MNLIRQIVKDGQYGTQTIKMIVQSNERGPKGETGEPGTAATIAAGQAYSVPTTQQPAVINTGTSSNAVFDFYIPRGEKGDKGDKGEPGQDGAPGAPGKDGAIQYTAGAGIKIQNNVISVTGGGGGGGVWGDIIGDIADQTDLQAEFDAKQDKLTAGNAITIVDNTINADIYPADYFTAGGTVTGTGSSFTLNKTIPATLNNVRLLGDTEQQTYTGKNILPNGITSQTFHGVIITRNADGSLVLNGTVIGDADNYYLNIGSIDAKQGQVYTISGLNDWTWNTLQLYTPSSIAFPSGNRLSSSDGPKTVTALGNETVTVNLYIYHGQTYNNAVVYPMVELSSTATDYEPYVGGVPAPNPDYPQDVHVVTGTQTVTINGKNLWNVDSITPSGNVTITQNGDEYELDWTGGFDALLPTISGLDPTRTYTLSFKHKGYKVNLRKVGASASILTTTESANYATSSWTFTGETSLSLEIIRSDSATNVTAFLKDFQIEANSTATDYEPYEGQSYTVDLGSYELCKIGDYQDFIYKSGDNWYLHKAVGKSELGSLTWQAGSTNQTGLYRMYSGDLNGMFVTPAENNIPVEAFCSHFVAVRNDSAGTYGCHIGLSVAKTGDNVFIYDTDYNQSTSGSNFKTWLQNNNAVFYYALTTPTDTKIMDATLISQLDALAGGKTYLDVTNFSVTATSTNLLAILDVEAYRNSAEGVALREPIASGGSFTQVQSDWDQSDSSAVDYIKNKPSIPTVNNATLTIQQNSVNVATFTANSATNATANITSPAITMTTTDPGEGSALAANNFTAVYGAAPLELDYSTSEVNTGTTWIDGSAIYKKTINFGTLPNATSKVVPHGIINLNRVLSISGYAYYPTNQVTYPLPFSSKDSASYNIGTTADQTNVEIGTGIDRSYLTECYITLYYTKSSS